MSARVLRRCLAVAVGATALLVVPTAAGAHVGAAGETVDGATTVTFTFHHGCDGSPTTSLRVQLPEDATDVEAQDPAGWTSTVADGELTWTGGSVAPDGDGEFVATMKLVGPEGTTVFLPTVQECPDGKEAAWIDRSDDPESANAAPRIVLGVAVADDHGEADETAGGHGSDLGGTVPEMTTNEADHGSADDAAESDVAAPATEAASTTSSSNAPIIIALVAVVLIGGAIGLIVSRRRSSSS